MKDLWRSKRGAFLKEIGCGLITVLVFTAPLWAFSAATRGPRYALTLIVALVVVLVTLAILSRLLRQR